MRRGYAALGLLALIWGAAFLFIKLGVRDMSPATLVFSRTLLGAFTLGLIFAARRQTPFPAGTRARLLPFVALAILGSLVPWVAIAFGEQSISSALASILNATTPLWTAVFAYWVTPAERPSGLNYLGVAIGFLGTGILIAPDLIGQPLRASTIGTLAVLGAACSYAVSALVARRRLRGVSPLQVGFWQLTLAAPLALALALPTIGATHLRVPSIAAMLFLGAGGSGIAFLLYYFMMNTLGRHPCDDRDLSGSGDRGLLGGDPPSRGDHHSDCYRHGRHPAGPVPHQPAAQVGSGADARPWRRVNFSSGARTISR